MRIDVFTIFPEYVEQPLAVSLVGRARESGLLDVRVHDPREHATGVHRPVDDAPFGGGAGMVMMPEPLFASIEAVQPPRPLLLLSAGGARFDQARARELAATGGFSLLCGRYEGVDQRVVELAVDLELSAGDYVLCGGEVPAMAVIEAVVRLLPGVLGNPASVEAESFGTASLEGPQYTRPAVFRGLEVPAVLRSGHHAEIARWRAEQALEWTRRRRPDLLAGRREERG